MRLCLLGLALFASNAYASGAVKIISYYEMILHSLGLHEHAIEEWFPVLAALLTFFLTVIIGLCYSSAVKRAADPAIPSPRFSIRTFVEGILEFVYSLARDVIGEREASRFFPILAGLFLFILVSNLTGLVPGFPPATESINTNLVLGLVVFIIYNVAGIKEHGPSYVKQFIGPVGGLNAALALLLGLIFILIETIAHAARPLSLSLRLYGNIFGDHLVLSVFTGITKLVVPAFLLFFGLLVACIQSFVFTLLSSIYISMAISHDH